MTLLALLLRLSAFVLDTNAQAANIPIHPITNVNVDKHTGYFSDPFHIPYEGNEKVCIGGTTPAYLECDGALTPECATKSKNHYNTSDALRQQAGSTTICTAAGIHPFQSGSGANRTWDAVVTLHVQDNPNCDGAGLSGWSVIVHAHPADPAEAAGAAPPTSWLGDKLLIGSFAQRADANYDGKYFRTPAGQLYLLFSKRDYADTSGKRDGVAAVAMDDPRTKTPGSTPRFLLLPDDGLNSENYRAGSPSFKLIETGNVRAIHGKFVMAYSAGGFANVSYKLGVAYSDTFLPPRGQGYRKVMKDNADRLWGSQKPKEVFYLLQADEKHAGWHYVGDQVLAPGVPTVANIGPNHSWVLTFAGYDPQDAPLRSNASAFQANHRRPYFVHLNVSVPENKSVKEATDAELQSWITPMHGAASGGG
ncbi:hypothetical protein AURDEDRAFT_187063 [Auricularia subglabra TFB-10046 SS5]|nr:hypothetical protein AURDEDRAFT_187063 [Auricularia subglabra TFB-10046 SS5]